MKLINFGFTLRFTIIFLFTNLILFIKYGNIFNYLIVIEFIVILCIALVNYSIVLITKDTIVINYLFQFRSKTYHKNEIDTLLLRSTNSSKVAGIDLILRLNNKDKNITLKNFVKLKDLPQIISFLKETNYKLIYSGFLETIK